MMQLWCWKLMIYLTSWCCSDVGDFHCFFVFLMSWSISDDGNVLLCPWASSAVLLMCLIDFLSKKHCCARCFVLFSHHETILMMGIYAFRFPSSHIMMKLWCWVLSFSFVFLKSWCNSDVVTHIMVQLWCWELMIFLTSWCCSDVGNFHCFFVFLISWSISDDGNVQLCPWASSAVLLMCLIDFLSKKHCYARCFVLCSTVHSF
jgi:hypothetical protein